MLVYCFSAFFKVLLLQWHVKMYNQKHKFKKCINDNCNLAPKDINYLFYLTFIKKIKLIAFFLFIAPFVGLKIIEKLWLMTNNNCLQFGLEVVMSNYHF